MARRIESINKIEILEENGKEIEIGFKPSPIVIREHDTFSKFIVIKMGNLTYTVLANDMIRAIQNAQNAHS